MSTAKYYCLANEGNAICLVVADKQLCQPPLSTCLSSNIQSHMYVHSLFSGISYKLCLLYNNNKDNNIKQPKLFYSVSAHSQDHFVVRLLLQPVNPLVISLNISPSCSCFQTCHS